MAQMDRNKNLVLRMLYYVVLIMTGFFFFFLVGERGPLIMRDAYSATEKVLPDGYMIYPMFIDIVRFVFGEESCVKWVFYIQSVWAIFSALILTRWIRKKFSLSYIVSYIMYVFSLLPYMYSLPEHVLSHEIMTESLAIPVFNIYMIYLIEFFLNNSKRNLIRMFFLNIILVFIRPQLLTLLAASIFICIIKLMVHFYEKLDVEKKSFFLFETGIVSMLILLGGYAIFIAGIGKFDQLTDAVASKVVYLIDEEDRELFSGTELEIFDELYTTVDNLKYRHSYYGDSIYETEEIMIAINHNTMLSYTVFEDCIFEKYTDSDYSGEELLQKTRQLRRGMIVRLLQEHLKDYIFLTCQLLPYSFVAAIFIQPDAIKQLCYLITLGIYLLTGVLMVMGRKQKEYMIPIVLTLIVLSINVLLTNMVFYAMQRYVIYTFGWFYISLLVLFIGLLRNKSNL